MLWMFFILQRKGIFRPVLVRNITTHDIPEIEEFLRERWEYMKNQWCEFSVAPAVDAEVVRHGRWNLNKHYGDYECSVCGEGNFRVWDFKEHNMNYYPNCGAKMDEEGINELRTSS